MRRPFRDSRLRLLECTLSSLTEEGFSIPFVYLEHGISIARFFLALLSAQSFRLLETDNISKSSKSAMSKSTDHPPPARQTQPMNPPKSFFFTDLVQARLINRRDRFVAEFCSDGGSEVRQFAHHIRSRMLSRHRPFLLSCTFRKLR